MEGNPPLLALVPKAHAIAGMTTPIMPSSSAENTHAVAAIGTVTVSGAMPEQSQISWETPEDMTNVNLKQTKELE